MRHTVRADRDDMKTKSVARSPQPRALGRLALAMAIAAIAVSLGAIAIAIFRELGESDPWSVVSALSALAVAIVAVLAFNQWKEQLRTRNRQAAATDVLERTYEDQELFWEINRHALQILLNKTYRQKFVNSDSLLLQHHQIMLDYTRQVQAVGARLHAALFKASVICGFEFPIDPNELVPLEGAVVWSWLTMAFIKAAALQEGSQERRQLLDEEFEKVKEALDKAPEAMNARREELKSILTPFFQV